MKNHKNSAKVGARGGSFWDGASPRELVQGSSGRRLNRDGSYSSTLDQWYALANTRSLDSAKNASLGMTVSRETLRRQTPRRWTAGAAVPTWCG